MTYSIELFRARWNPRLDSERETLKGARAYAYSQMWKWLYDSMGRNLTLGIFDKDNGEIIGAVSYYTIPKKKDPIICWTAVTKRGYRVSRLNKDGTLGELIAEYV